MTKEITYYIKDICIFMGLKKGNYDKRSVLFIRGEQIVEGKGV